MESLRTIDYKTIQDRIHKAWLAGVGAASSGAEQGAKLFDELVERGRAVEETGKERIAAARQRTETTLGQLKAEIDERTEKLVQRLGVPHRQQIETLAARVAELTRKVEALQKAAGLEHLDIDRAVFYLTPDDGGWKITEEGSDAPISRHDTKDAALAAGRDLAQSREPSQLVVHRLDGTFQTSYSYGE